MEVGMVTMMRVRQAGGGCLGVMPDTPALRDTEQNQKERGRAVTTECLLLFLCKCAC